jgi:hypothetical protein
MQTNTARQLKFNGTNSLCAFVENYRFLKNQFSVESAGGGDNVNVLDNMDEITELAITESVKNEKSTKRVQQLRVKLSDLCAHFVGRPLDKKACLSDWTRRPLRVAQVNARTPIVTLTFESSDALCCTRRLLSTRNLRDNARACC